MHREHVLAAVQEYDELGQSRFLVKYGFRAARFYQLVVHLANGTKQTSLVSGDVRSSPPTRRVVKHTKNC